MGLTVRKTKARLQKNFLRIRIVKHWTRLPREVMTSLSVKVFKMTLLNMSAMTLALLILSWGRGIV